jgi:hypothetical protein
MGNDTSLYDGPSKSQVYNSFVELYSDLITDLGVSLKRAQISLISLWIGKFLDAFWKESRSCLNGQEVKDFADRCKQRRNDVLQVVSDCITGKAPAFPGDYYILDKQPRKLVDLSYYPNSFLGVINYMEEINEIISCVQLSQRPGFYVYLHKILFHLISSFDITEEEYDNNKEKVVQILLLSVSLGQVYEHMNPTPEVMEEYGQDLLNQLREESSDPSDDFWSLFNEVVKDINSPKTKRNRYVHDIIDARRAFLESERNVYQTGDYYLTAKASTSEIKIDGKKVKLNALYSSILEYDPLKGDETVERFDKLIGYQSGYLSSFDLPDQIKLTLRVVITQMIPNPGKFKPRGIHVGCNSVQDRCKYLHRVFARFLNLIESCCMNQHFRGVEFLKKVTMPSYRIEFQNNVFVSDFSNATDTLNQEFQCRVIEVLFNKTYADFWRVISHLPKTFRHPQDNSYEDYIQNTGQPQGLLASFDAFSLAHIFLVCMLMKMYNMGNVSLSDTLAIVGDDSVISYPSRYELSPELGVTFYQSHSWLCKEVSLIKNESKTGKSFFNESGYYSHEVLDFAKISIQDGLFMTPMPYGLAAGYSKQPGFTDLQLFFWLNSKGLTYKQIVYKKVFNAFYTKPDQLMAVTSVLSSGELNFLKEFKDDQLSNSIDSSIRGVSMYTFYLNQLEHTFLSSILSENQKECLENENFLERSLATLEKDFYKFKDVYKYIPFLPDNHKYNIMITENMQLADDLQFVLDQGDNFEEVSLLLGVLMSEEYQALFDYMIDIKRNIDNCLLDDKEEIWEYLCFQDFGPLKDLSDPLKNFQVKSMKKVSSRSTILLKASARKAHQLIGQSSYLRECQNSCMSNFIDNYLQLAGITE